MDTVYVRGKKMMRVRVEDAYRALVSRSWRLYSRYVSNVSMILTRHFQDTDASYLNSEEFQELFDRAVDGMIDKRNIIFGAACNIVHDYEGEYKIPSDYQFDQNENPYDTFLYAFE